MKKELLIVLGLVLFVLPSLHVEGQIPAGWNCNVLGPHGIPGSAIAFMNNITGQSLIRADGFGRWYLITRTSPPPSFTDFGTLWTSVDGKSWTLVTRQNISGLAQPGKWTGFVVGLTYGPNAGTGSSGRLVLITTETSAFDLNNVVLAMAFQDSPSPTWTRLSKMFDPSGRIEANVTYPRGIGINYNQSSKIFAWGVQIQFNQQFWVNKLQSQTWSLQQISPNLANVHVQGSMIYDSKLGFVWLLGRSSGGTSAILKSPTGELNSWTKVRETSDSFVGMATNGTGTIVFVKNIGSPPAVRTTDLVTFTGSSGLPSNTWRSVAFGGDVWFAIAEAGDNNRFAISSNGVNWNAFQAPITDSWRVIAYGADLGAFLILGDTYSVLCQGPPPPSVTLSIKSLASDCSNAVLGWKGGVAPFNLQKSPNGITWTNVLSGTTATDFFVSPVTSDLWRVQSSPFGRGIYSNVLSIMGLGGSCGLVVGGAPGDPNSLPNVLFGSSDPAAIQEAGLWVALLLVGILTVAGGSMGASVGLAGAGAGAGAVLGWIVSYGLGLLPLWVVIASVIVVGGALLLWRRVRV